MIYEKQLEWDKDKPLIAPGLHDIPNKQYQKSAGVSRSGLVELKKSPLHFYKYSTKENETNDSMAFGNAVHDMLLMPEVFASDYIEDEKYDKRFTVNKKKAADFAIKANGRTPISRADCQKLFEINLCIKKNPLWLELIEGAECEKSFYWVDKSTGILCKARPDILKGSLIADIKTTRDSSYQAFTYAVRDYGYHIQAAMQIDALKAVSGREITKFYFIVIQNTAPFEPYIYKLGQNEIDQGRIEYRNLLKVFKACLDSGDWQKDRKEVAELNMPSYFFNDGVINTLLNQYECPIN